MLDSLERYSFWANTYTHDGETWAEVERDVDMLGPYVKYDDVERELLRLNKTHADEVEHLKKLLAYARFSVLRNEDQGTVSDWAVETFGDTGSNTSCAARALLEVSELVFELAKDDRSPKGPAEIADAVICLYRLAERLGCDLHEEVDKKMAINRQREWVVEGGHGQHKETK